MRHRRGGARAARWLRAVATAGALALAVPAVMAVPASAGPESGAAAPGFELADQHGRLHRLEQYRGTWLVLYFYPKASTPGCTEQACAFRDDIIALRRAGARVVGVSLDDVASQAEFAERHQVPFPLLSDADGDTARRYGVLDRRADRGAYSRRETFLIDAAGTVVRRYRDVDPQENAAQVLADINRAGG